MLSERHSLVAKTGEVFQALVHFLRALLHRLHDAGLPVGRPGRVVTHTLGIVVARLRPYRRVIVPTNAFRARVNISSQGALYDSLAEFPEINYLIRDSITMTAEEINAGLNLYWSE